LLVKLQKQSFGYLRELEKGQLSDEKLGEISFFCEKELNNFHPSIDKLSRAELQQYLHTKLNRPMRVCGMVKTQANRGEALFLR